MLFAENIYLENLKDFVDVELNFLKSKEEINEETKGLFFGLAEVYLKMGDLETCKSDFQMAVEKYLRALKIRKALDNTFSRLIAEIYFNLAKVYDYDAKKCMLCFVKARLIMEYHIKAKLVDAGKVELAEKIKIDDTILDLEELDYKTVKMKNELYYENDNFTCEGLLPNNILDLGDIVKQLDQKVF